MNQPLERRRVQCSEILERLLAAPAHKFDDTLRSKLPLKHGIYAIAESDGESQGEYLHAGQSGTAKEGLKSRIWVQHYCGGDSRRGSSDLVQKVMDRQSLARPDAKLWIRKNCIVRWLVPDMDINDWRWAEHYMLSILRPKWGR
ncbi:MAG TPA: hypothetical protein VMG82_36605 [Candidatus Sulfotelmatobacter sp.]|nr:hypothetical protein [Candidatus Sulfotelmatobacter sp.]